MNNKLHSMLRLAVDPRTPEAEATAALLALRRSAGALQFIDELSGPTPAGAPQTIIVERTPEFVDPTLPFKKCEGKRVSQFMATAEGPGFLCWVMEKKVGSDFLRNQIALAFAMSAGRADR